MLINQKPIVTACLVTKFSILKTLVIQMVNFETYKWLAHVFLKIVMKVNNWLDVFV